MMSTEAKDSPAEGYDDVLIADADDDVVLLVAPERHVPDLELPDWQNGHWPSSKNVTQ
jgi:hypothetical protein